MTTTRNPWIVGAAVLFVLAVLTVGVTDLVEETFGGREQHEETLTAQVPRLDLRADRGEVTLSASPDDRVHVRTESTYALRAPAVTRESTPTGVRLESRCGDGSCQTDWEVAVPADFAVGVDAQGGAVRLRDLRGTVRVAATSQVELSGLSGPVTARTAAGDVRGTDLRSPAVTVETYSGDLDLAFSTPPTSVTMAATAQGDLTLTVPSTQGYRVDATTNTWGERRVTVPLDPTSPTTLHATTQGGNVTIRPT